MALVGHGSGGLLSADLMRRVFLPAYGNDILTALEDQATVNLNAQHGVAPYGVRPRPGAPVAMPIAWEELSDPKLKPDRWTIKDAGARLRSEGDAWKGIGRRARKLPLTGG